MICTDKKLTWILIIALVIILSVTIFLQTGESEAIVEDIELDEPPTIEEVTEIVEVEPEPTWINLGKFKLTAYCPCAKCCGKSDGVTATGIVATPNRTIAVDPKVIPLGSTVKINGQTYIAEDVGGVIHGDKIDIFFLSHQEAINHGVQYAEVYLKNGGN